MNTYLDIRTLVFISGVLSLVLWFAMFYIYLARKTYPGFGQWLYGTLFNAAGMLLICLRDYVPDFFSIVAANIFIILYLVFLTSGINAFLGGRQRIWPYILSVVFLTITAIHFTYVTPSLSARIIIISSLLILYGVYFGVLVERKVPLLLGGRNWFLTITIYAFVCWLIVRIILTIILERHSAGFMSASAIQGASFVIFAVLNVAVTVGLITLNFQRVELDLRKSAEEISTLKGIIPICANCKKIRDDQGYWNHLEKYIREHADVEFSHGICPECREKLYPGFK